MNGAAWTLAMLYICGAALIACSFIPWVRRSRRACPVPAGRRVRVPAGGRPLTRAEKAAWGTAVRACAAPDDPELAGYEQDLEQLMQELTGGGE